MTKEGVLGEHVLVKDTEKSVEPTCTENGHSVNTCSVCGEVVEKDEQALGHTFPTTKTVTKEVSCTEDGMKAFVCERCGEVKEEEVIPSTGHEKNTEMDIVKDATFFTDGTGQYTCKNCDEVIETVTIPAKGGVWRFVIPVVSVFIIGSLVTFIVIKRKNGTK